jgi:hypothetical protein
MELGDIETFQLRTCRTVVTVQARMYAYQHPVFDIGITCRCYPQLGPVAQRHPGRTPAICSAVTFSLMSTGSPTAATSSGRPWGIPGSLLCPGASGERPWRRARGAVASLHVAQATSRGLIASHLAVERSSVQLKASRESADEEGTGSAFRNSLCLLCNN